MRQTCPRGFLPTRREYKTIYLSQNSSVYIFLKNFSSREKFFKTKYIVKLILTKYKIIEIFFLNNGISNQKLWNKSNDVLSMIIYYYNTIAFALCLLTPPPLVHYSPPPFVLNPMVLDNSPTHI